MESVTDFHKIVSSSTTNKFVPIALQGILYKTQSAI